MTRLRYLGAVFMAATLAPQFASAQAVPRGSSSQSPSPSPSPSTESRGSSESAPSAPSPPRESGSRTAPANAPRTGSATSRQGTPATSAPPRAGAPRSTRDSGTARPSGTPGAVRAVGVGGRESDQIVFRARGARPIVGQAAARPPRPIVDFNYVPSSRRYPFYSSGYGWRFGFAGYDPWAYRGWGLYDPYMRRSTQGRMTRPIRIGTPTATPRRDPFA
jgi:hypothetical protein